MNQTGQIGYLLIEYQYNESQYFADLDEVCGYIGDHENIKRAIREGRIGLHRIDAQIPLSEWLDSSRHNPSHIQ